MKTNRRTITSTARTVSSWKACDVMGGKTGFISKAGYCLATLLRLPQSNTRSRSSCSARTSNNGRFWETRHLFNWLSDKASASSARTPQQ